MAIDGSRGNWAHNNRRRVKKLPRRRKVDTEQSWHRTSFSVYKNKYLFTQVSGNPTHPTAKRISHSPHDYDTHREGNDKYSSQLCKRIICIYISKCSRSVIFFQSCPNEVAFGPWWPSTSNEFDTPALNGDLKATQKEKNKFPHSTLGQWSRQMRNFIRHYEWGNKGQAFAKLSPRGTTKGWVDEFTRSLPPRPYIMDSQGYCLYSPSPKKWHQNSFRSPPPQLDNKGR